MGKLIREVLYESDGLEYVKLVNELDSVPGVDAEEGEVKSVAICIDTSPSVNRRLLREKFNALISSFDEGVKFTVFYFSADTVETKRLGTSTDRIETAIKNAPEGVSSGLAKLFLEAPLKRFGKIYILTNGEFSKDEEGREEAMSVYRKLRKRITWVVPKDTEKKNIKKIDTKSDII